MHVHVHRSYPCSGKAFSAVQRCGHAATRESGAHSLWLAVVQAFARIRDYLQREASNLLDARASALERLQIHALSILRSRIKRSTLTQLPPWHGTGLTIFNKSTVRLIHCSACSRVTVGTCGNTKHVDGQQDSELGFRLTRALLVSDYLPMLRLLGAPRPRPPLHGREHRAAAGVGVDVEAGEARLRPDRHRKNQSSPVMVPERLKGVALPLPASPQAARVLVEERLEGDEKALRKEWQEFRVRGVPVAGTNLEEYLLGVRGYGKVALLVELRDVDQCEQPGARRCLHYGGGVGHGGAVRRVGREGRLQNC
eukprot:2189846-Prymnesium_polylepis.1